MTLNFEAVCQREWKIVTENESIVISLGSSTVTNKYQIVTDYITKISETIGQEFDNWFINFLKDYNSNKDTRLSLLYSNLDKIKYYSDTYLDILNIDYSQFVDESKAKKNSILFYPNEIKNIIKLSGYLKLYSIFSNRTDFEIGIKNHKNIYNELAREITDQDIASKIMNVVQTKTFRYNITDKAMWEYIRNIQCKDIPSHVIEIFNFIMNNIIILCEPDKNPITYFVGVIDESVKWFLRSVYKSMAVYEDEISTEDIHGIHTNNLRNYSFNDTLGRIKSIAFEKIYERLDQDNILTVEDNSDQHIINFNNRLLNIQYISPLCSCLVFPVLSKITQISYPHFNTISPEHAAVLSYYLNRLFSKAFKNEYKNLFTLMDYYPESQPSLNTTYKIKNYNEYLSLQNATKNFFGFNHKKVPHEMLCHFIGRVSRINFTHLLTGQKLAGIPLGKVELDMLKFYTELWAGKLNDKFSELEHYMNIDF